MIFNTTVSTSTPAIADDQGVDVPDWTDTTVVDRNVPASVQQMSQNDVFTFARRGADADYDVFTAQRLTAKQEDRLTDAAGNTYRIAMPTEDMAGRGRMFRTACKKLTPVGG